MGVKEKERVRVRVRKVMESSRLRIAMVVVLTMSSDQSLTLCALATADCSNAQGNSAHAVQTNTKDPDSTPLLLIPFLCSWRTRFANTTQQTIQPGMGRKDTEAGDTHESDLET